MEDGQRHPGREHFAAGNPTSRPPKPKPPPADLKLTAEQEKEMILRALEDNLWIQKDAALQLGISPRALNYRVKKLGISHHRWRKNK